MNSDEFRVNVPLAVVESDVDDDELENAAR
jgi:hypothetical protein